MELQTKIGALQVKEEEIINFPMGLLGFGDLHRYIVVKKKTACLAFCSLWMNRI